MDTLTLENLKRVPESIGVYKLYAKKIDGQSIPLNRFGGIDNTGLLYLGRTTKQNLRKRLYNLLAASREVTKTTNHTCGVKYRTNPMIKAILQEHVLCFEFEVCEDPKSREGELLNSYSFIYGEYPPLNK